MAGPARDRGAGAKVKLAEWSWPICLEAGLMASLPVRVGAGVVVAADQNFIT